MSPLLSTQAGQGQWVWDLEEARMLESKKRAAQVKVCADLPFAQSEIPAMGWCPSTGRAVLTDGKGNPAYPRVNDCPGGGIVMSAAQCPTTGGGGGGNGGGSGGGGSSGSSTTISGTCTDGSLTPACLSLLSSQVCGSAGTLAGAYGSGWPSASTQFTSTNAIASRGFELDASLLAGGKTTVQAALRSFQGLRTFAYSNADPSLARSAAAAANLCGGQSFDPCAMSATDRAPFDAGCINKALLAAGYKPTGALVQNIAYWNGLGTWGAVQTAILAHKTAADTPGPQQIAEIANVYGTRVRVAPQGCNVAGVVALRYLAPSTDTSLFPASGAQTHFLGRLLLGGIPTSNPVPAGGYPNENIRFQTVFVPTVGGSYQFMVSSSAGVRVGLAGKPYLATTGAQQVGPPVDLTPGTPYPFVIDVANGSSNWTFMFSYRIGTGSWGPAAQLMLPQDRRRPLLDLPFHTWASSGRQVQDSGGIFQNWVLTAAIGTLDGQPCMIVDGPGKCLANFGPGFNQGLRLWAFKSFTMRLRIDTSVTDPSSTTPAVFSVYNWPESVTTGYPRRGQPPEQVDSNKINHFAIMSNGAQMYPWGSGPMYRTTTTTANNEFYNALSGSTVSIQNRTWFHYAFVWDDDFRGLTVFVNGVQAGRALLTAPFDPNLLLEQIRIGCDALIGLQQWTGGIAWFRGFDYRLSPDLIAVDMADGWAGQLP